LSFARAKEVNHVETEPDASESPSKKGTDFEPEHHSSTNSEVPSHAHDSRTLRLLLEGAEYSQSSRLPHVPAKKQTNTVIISLEFSDSRRSAKDAKAERYKRKMIQGSKNYPQRRRGRRRRRSKVQPR
jgi:hypothetical protein